MRFLAGQLHVHPGVPESRRAFGRTFAALLALLLLIPGVASAQAASTTPTVETIVARMAQTRDENRALMRPYKLTRIYKLFAKGKEQPKSEVTAEITFTPPGTRTYKIINASGMGLGEKIVREMLDGETQIVKQSDSNDIAPENYRFQLLGEQQENGRKLYVLELFPKRQDKHLLHAKIFVDALTFRLQRMSGEPGKSPSWWLRDPHITFFHSEVSGMWLQVGSESTVNVRFFGEYKMVSHDLSYEVSKAAVASN